MTVQTGARMARAPAVAASGALRVVLLSLLLGAASVLAFAPFYLWPVVLVTLTGFAWLIDRASGPRRAAVLGLAFGLGYFLTGTSWVYVSMHDFGGMSVPLAMFATAFFCTYLALFPAAVAWLARLAPAGAPRLALVFPAAWAFAEWVRGWMFTGFPWLTIGYSQSPGGTLSGYAPIAGSYGISLAVAASAGLLAWWSPWTRWRAGHRTVLMHPAPAILLALWMGGVVLRHVAWTAPMGEPLVVSLVQGNIKQELKWRPEAARATLDTYLRLTLAAKSPLIVLPEAALPMLDVEVPRAYFEILVEHARRNGGDILIGVPEYVSRHEYYNSVFSLGTRPRQVYRKHHLVPFGDYTPQWFFVTWVMSALDIPMSGFARGPALQDPMQVAGQRVAVNICYEDVFGEEIIRQLPAATMLANFTNDAWWGDSMASDQHLQMAQMRAQETGRYMLRATNTGVTSIIDERGRVIASAPKFVATVVDGTAQGYSGSTPYVWWGNGPFLLLTAGMLLIPAARAAQRRTRVPAS